MFHIRFPYEFEEYYGQKYGGRTSYYPSHMPPTIQISYALSDNEIARKGQQFHMEKMAAERKKVIETIKSKAGFKMKYPCYPAPRANALPHKNITSGTRPFLTAVSQPSFGNVGRLSTFAQHDELSGGVLKNYAYARQILDRRAKNIREQEDPAFQPPSQVLTGDEQMKLDFSSLLNEVVDAITAGSFSDMVYNATRKLVGAFIRVVPKLDDVDDIADITRAIENALQSADALTKPGDRRDGVAVIRDEVNRAEVKRRDRIANVLGKMELFLDEYADRVKRGTMSEKDRIALAKTLAKKVGLFSFADFTATAVIKRDEEEDEEDEDEEDEDEEGAPDLVEGDEDEADEAEDDEDEEEAEEEAPAEEAPAGDFRVVNYKGRVVNAPTKLSVLRGLNKQQLLDLARRVARPNKVITNGMREGTLVGYIIERLAADFKAPVRADV